MKRKIVVIIILLSNLIGALYTTNMVQMPKKVNAVENNLNLKRDVTKGVIIHNDAGNISGSQYRYLESYSETQLARGFAHYYVAKGDIYKFWDDSKVAWHSGNFSGNTEYIGVEVTNSYGAEARFLENEQESFKLVAQLLVKYNLQPNRDTIRLHKEFSATACPHRSWALHGGSTNAVKDYFISQVKKYMPTVSYALNIGQNVQLVSTAGLAIDNSSITEADRRLIGVVTARSVMVHQGNGLSFPSYTIKWSNGVIKSYVYFDVQASAEEKYPLKIGESVKLTAKATHAVDNSVIPASDKGLVGIITNRQLIIHQGSGKYVPAYTVKWSTGKLHNYITVDLEKAPQPTAKIPKIKYAAHVQEVGWQTYVEDGKTSGTVGRAMRLEAIKITLDNLPTTGGITYSSFVQGIGWQAPVSNNQISGTTGKALRMEAINIKLTGEIAKTYDVYYRVHLQDYGWIGWTKNGENAGSLVKKIRIEAIEIKLVKKGDKAPQLGKALII